MKFFFLLFSIFIWVGSLSAQETKIYHQGKGSVLYHKNCKIVVVEKTETTGVGSLESQYHQIHFMKLDKILKRKGYRFTRQRFFNAGNLELRYWIDHKDDVNRYKHILKEHLSDKSSYSHGSYFFEFNHFDKEDLFLIDEKSSNENIKIINHDFGNYISQALKKLPRCITTNEGSAVYTNYDSELRSFELSNCHQYGSDLSILVDAITRCNALNNTCQQIWKDLKPHNSFFKEQDISKKAYRYLAKELRKVSFATFSHKISDFVAQNRWCERSNKKRKTLKNLIREARLSF